MSILSVPRLPGSSDGRGREEGSGDWLATWASAQPDERVAATETGTLTVTATDSEPVARTGRRIRDPSRTRNRCRPRHRPRSQDLTREQQLRPAKASRGFTLMELLAATAVFGMLGVMLFGILQGSLELWRRGESGRDFAERADRILDRLALDLRHVVADNTDGSPAPRVQFRCDFVGADTNGDSVIDRRVQRLRFVRVAYEARTRALLTESGTDPLAREYFNLITDEERRQGKAFLPYGGLGEVCFVPVGATTRRDDGLLTLLWAFRSPVGGDGSLFQDASVEEPGLKPDVFEELATGLLHLGFAFRLPSSGSFEEGVSGGVGRVWDSTRAILPASGTINAFAFAQSEEELGEDPLARTHDDLFPYQVEITLILGPASQEGQQTELLSPVAEEVDRPLLEVRSTTALLRAEGVGKLVKVGGEWMEFEKVDASRIHVQRRALLDSPRSPHQKGEPVRFGQRFRRVVTIPCFREVLDG
ncbi:MAG: type II secretion system protein [Planctomycetota bacterium]